MRIIIIGSVAAGTSVAAKAVRNCIENEVVIYEKDTDISYSVCGLPYYIGEDYIEREHLTPRNSMWFKKRFGIDIFIGHEVLEIYNENRKLIIKNLETDEIKEDYYDKLVIATGALPRKLNIEGIENNNVFHLKNVKDADNIKKYIVENNVKKAVIIGSGFVGLEVLENFIKKDIDTVVIEKEKHIMPNLDEDVSVYVENYMNKKGIKYICGKSVQKIIDNGKTVILENGEKIETDIIISAAGVIPNIKLAERIGVNIGKNKGILVNETMETNVRDVYAVGDCCEHFNLILNDYVYRPMGSTANKMGRIAGDVITGGSLEFQGILGTGILRLFDLSIGYTGLTEKEALKYGYTIETIHNIKEDKSKYLNESREILIKAVADKKTGKILGVQIVGEAGVDKRLDVFVTAITFGARAKDLFHLDLAYAPPFSTTKDPVMYTGMVLDNAINNQRKILSVKELKNKRDEFTVIDVRSEKDYEKGHIEGALNIPLSELKKESAKFDKTSKIVVHCNKGVTGNAAQNLLINLGFENVYNLSGGYKNYKMSSNII